jgi:hypothetical protein
MERIHIYNTMASARGAVRRGKEIEVPRGSKLVHCLGHRMSD